MALRAHVLRRPRERDHAVTHGLVHRALVYASEHEYVAGVGAFLDAGAAAGEPMLVAVPGPNRAVLQRAFAARLPAVGFIEMERLGRNPGRIIPAIRAFVDEHGGRPVRFVGEPVWPGRSAAETVEGTRHEALINLAFADLPVTILCPYDGARLPAEVLADAACTHPEVVAGGACRASAAYADPAASPLVLDVALPDPAGRVTTLPGTDSLAAIRGFTRDEGAAAGLGPDRVADLVLAVNEVAANALRHTGEPPQLRAWPEAGGVVVELGDPGHIVDLLAGRQEPSAWSESGRGLWLVHQLCDLVQVRSSAGGTRVRLFVAA
jgi:anti-sigma regulatory factor (Ser/Thr protein kinase)